MRRTLLGLALVWCAPLAAQTPATWRLVEEWRIGGEPDGPYSFERIRDVDAAPGGKLIVLDRGLRQVHIYDSTGRAIRTVGRMGSGPGEFRTPDGVAVATDGGFVVNDPTLARVSVFTASGDFVRTATVPRRITTFFEHGWDATFDTAGRLHASIGIRATVPDPRMPRMLAGMGDSALATERWTRDYTRSDTLSVCGAPLPAYLDPSRYYVTLPSQRGGSPAIGQWLVPFAVQRPYFVRDREGREWGPANPGSGDIVRRESGRCGAVLARAALRGPRSRIPTASRDSAMRGMYEVGRDRVPREHPWYNALWMDDEDQLWVERIVDAGRRFEVFDAAGRAVAEVGVPKEMFVDARASFPRVVVAHGRVYGFVKDADGVQYLVAWRIVR